MEEVSIVIKADNVNRIHAILDDALPLISRSCGMKLLTKFEKIEITPEIRRRMGRARARTITPINEVYVSTERFSADTSLFHTLCEEICHVIQSRKESPLYFSSWKSVFSYEYMVLQARNLLQCLATLCNVKVTAGRMLDMANDPNVVSILPNLFADADANSFLVKKRILGKSSYFEFLSDFSNHHMDQAVESGQYSNSLMEKIKSDGNLNKKQKLMWIAWIVWGKYAYSVGGVWDRLICLEEADRENSKVQSFISSLEQADRLELQTFHEPRLIREKWNELLSYTEDHERILRTLIGLASDCTDLAKRAF